MNGEGGGAYAIRTMKSSSRVSLQQRSHIAGSRGGARYESRAAASSWINAQAKRTRGSFAFLDHHVAVEFPQTQAVCGGRIENFMYASRLGAATMYDIRSSSASFVIVIPPQHGKSRIYNCF